ncbi:MAG: thioredoxin domain-containing protein [Pseudomonadales bacterium]
MIGVAAVLILAASAAMVFVKRDDAEPRQDAALERQLVLTREHSPTLGNPSAKVHIVEFLDPACGTCALFYPIVKEWMAEVPGDIRLTVRHVGFHDGADYAVRILEASRNQNKYWQTLEALLASQAEWVEHHVVQPDKIGPILSGVGLDMAQLKTDMKSVEVLQRIEIDKKDSILLKIKATPEYFVNGQPLPSFGVQQLADLVRVELQK